MLRFLCLTPWFPDRPGEREGNYIFDSVMACRDHALDMRVMVARAWKPWRREQFDAQAFEADLDIRLVHYGAIPRDYLRSLSNRLLFSGVFGAALAYAREHELDLIHAHTEGLAEVAVALGRELNIPVVVTIHGINTSKRFIGNDRQREHFRTALNRCDRIVLVGEPLRPFFGELCGRDEHFRVVHNGFRLTGQPPGPRTILEGDVARLISVSNLHEGKGIDLTVRALAQLREQGVDRWHYTIVGDGYERSGLEKLVTDLALGDQVRFAGAVAHEAVADYLGRADIFVLPSWREAFGIAYLEAMACGLAVIGVKGQGAAEFIRHGENGFLVEPKSVNDLAMQIRDLVDAPEWARQIAEAGRRTASEDFNWEKHASRVASLYREMVDEKGGV